MIAIVFVLNPEFAPYIKKYIKIIDSLGYKYNLIFWDRLGTSKLENENYIVFKSNKKLSSGKISKVISYFRFRKFVNKELSKEYKQIFALSTLSGFMISSKNLKKYSNSIFFDIRDYTYEKISLFKYYEKRIINNSFAVAISSKGFLNFLPKSSKYIINHNIPANVNFESLVIPKKNQAIYPIVISFIGAIRHFHIDKKVIKIFGNDNRFKLEFHGYGMTYEKLLKFIHNKYINVNISGFFNNDSKKILYSNSSIINNYYSNNYVNKYAISNKFYDSLIYNIPIWGNPKVFLGEYIKQNGLGFGLILDKQIKEKLIIEYENFDYDTFRLNCRNLLKEIISEENHFESKIIEFLNHRNR